MRTIRLSNGIDLRLHELAGDGLPLLFIHGLGCASSCDYPAVTAAPALRGRRALLVDLPGYGFSDKPDAFSYGIDAHAAAVEELMDLLGLRRVDLFGHSMGGAVAITVAARRRERVEHLVLSEPNLDTGGGVFSRAIASASEQDHVTRGHADVIRDALASGSQAWAGSVAIASPRAVHRDAVSLVRGADPSWRTQLLGLAGLPRTLVFGEHSLPDDDHAGFPAQGVDVDVVPAAGHAMAVENPAGLAAAIARACLA